MDASPERQMVIVYRKLHYIVIGLYDNQACLNGLNPGYLANYVFLFKIGLPIIQN